MATADDFIKSIAFYIQKYAPQYDIRVISPIIAQACIESAFGKSKLSAEYHNYFGLTCGIGWTGKSVSMKTWEEYTPGTKTDITQCFRVYDSMDAGVKGYFDFIQYPRYKNLKGVTDPHKYLELIKADGYATASNYVSANWAIVQQYNLTKYDTEKVDDPAAGAAPSPAPVVERASYSFTVKEVRKGDSGKSAALMQKCLRGLGYTGSKGKPITIDAAAGANTIYALKQFQRKAGLSPDGICGERSWKILLDVNTLQVEKMVKDDDKSEQEELKQEVTDMAYGFNDDKTKYELGDILGDFANIENGSTASRGYRQGHLIVHDLKLYRVISAIDEGDAFVEGTNIQQTNIGQEAPAVKYIRFSVSAADLINVWGNQIAAGDFKTYSASINILNEYYTAPVEAFDELLGFSGALPIVKAADFNNYGMISATNTGFSNITGGKRLTVYIHVYNPGNTPIEIANGIEIYVLLLKGTQQLTVA